MAQYGALSLSFFSIVLLATAAVIALRLAPITGRKLPWILVAGAFASLSIREGLAFVEVLSDAPSSFPLQAGPGAWPLVIASILLLLGMAFLRPVMRAIRGSVETIGDSERRYRTVFEHSRDAIYLVDRRGRIIDFNPALQELFGYERPEMLGMDIARLYRDPDARRGFLERLHEEGFVNEYELLLVRKDGSPMHCLITASVRSGCEQADAEYQGIIRDISNRKRMQEMLRLNNSILNAILTASPIGISMVRDRTFIWVNDTMHLMLGYEPSSLQGKNARVLYPSEEDFERVGKELYGEADSTGLTRSVARWVKSDGTSMVCLLQASSFGTDQEMDSGKIVAVMDISELKRAEERLRESENRYRAFFEEDLTGVYVLTPEGRLLDCNAAFLRIFGFGNLDEAMKTSFDSLCPTPASQRDLQARLHFEGKVEYHQRELRTREGKPVHVIENLIGHFDTEGNLSQVKGYLFDNTALKDLEAQLLHSQKMEAIGRLAGGVAHDFNNLLTAITGYCDLVLRGLGSAHPLHHKVEEIKRAGDRAATLTRQLLAFSRKQVLLPKVINLNGIITDMEKMLHRLIGEDVALETRLATDLGMVKADPGQIEQVIMNLAVNARDAMPKGGRLLIETSNSTLDEEYSKTHVDVPPGEYVVLSVSDTGVGMDEEIKSRLFEPFFTTKEKDKGTGLGLATIYGIVTQSNGHITVESEPGQGAAFRIALPQVAPSTEGTRATVRESSEKCTGSETILLVEDDEMVRSILTESLSSGGYSVLEADHGMEAIDVCRDRGSSIDLLITDLVMPGMDGRELATILTESHPRLKVLYMSGYADKGIGTGDEPGIPASAFLQKPFRLHALAAKIREILDS